MMNRLLIPLLSQCRFLRPVSSADFLASNLFGIPYINRRLFLFTPLPRSSMLSSSESSSSSAQSILPPIPLLLSTSIISIDNLVNGAERLLLPPISLVPENPPPLQPSDFNPALVHNNTRPTARDDAAGFGPALKNEEKMAQGIRCMDNPVCTDLTHCTGYARVNLYRQKNTCRECVKEAVASLPAHVTHMQTVRFLTALFRNYFCPFCMLEETDKSKLHLVRVKKTCKVHHIINRFTYCQHPNQLWQNCVVCSFDPRAGTAVCACGNLLRESCICDPALKAQSWGIRFHVNPFKVLTAEEQADDANLVQYNIQRATSMRLREAELEGQLPPKRARKSVVARRPSVKPVMIADL